MIFNIFLKWIPLGIIIIISSIYALIMWAGTGSAKRRYDEERRKDANYQTDYSRLIQVYEFLSRFPLTSKSTNQLHDIIAGLSMYNDLEARLETARIGALSYLMTIVIVTLAIVITNGELTICTAVFVLSLAFRRDMVNKRLRKKRLKFWQELYTTIVSLQQEFQRSKSLTTAFGMHQSEPTTKYLMRNIEYITKAEDPESALTYFCANNPFHICIRLAYLCYNTHLYSPVYIEKEGVDSFTDGLDSLLQDLLIEIDLASEEKKKFYIVEKLPLIGFLFLFGGPSFMTGYFPGLRYYYDDGFGFASLIISMVTVLGAYTLATRLNDKDSSQEDVTYWEIKKFEDTDYSNKWRNRAGDKRVKKFTTLIDQSLSYLTPAMVMFRKTLCSIIFLVLSIALCVGYIIVERRSLEKNFETIPETVITALESNYTDYNFIIKKSYVKDSGINTKDEMKAYLMSQGWNLSDSDIELLSNQVWLNKERLAVTEFQWWHLMIGFFCMCIGYYLQEMLLSRRAKLVQFEAKSEVLLLQSVVCQLMHTPLKLRDYLIFFSSVSRLYMDMHLLCYIWQFNHPQFIKEQAYKMFDPEYYLLMEQLYSLHSDMKPTQIFRQTASKRKYLAGKFLKAREETLADNYRWLSAFLKASLLIPVILQVVLPLASFVGKALEQYSSMMPG